MTRCELEAEGTTDVSRGSPQVPQVKLRLKQDDLRQ